MVLKDDRQLGVASVNLSLGAGVPWELIQRQFDLAPVTRRFLEQPRETGRMLSRLGR